jgi:iron complex outermembrane receptor protein
MGRSFFSVRPLAATLAFVFASVVVASAQNGSLSGKVTRDNGDVMGGATVALEELRRETLTNADGTFRFENVPSGRYHVSVRAEGYTTPRTEVEVTAQGATIDLVVELDLHFQEVVSVSPTGRGQFESYQPTVVLSGQELQQQIDSTLGATLRDEPGVAMRSLGTGPARPVIRGLDGDRIAILTDGQRTGDLSSQSADHGVTVNPASASRIEVVRGPATLLYGANAIGGLVNVLTDQVATTPVNGTNGSFTFDFGSNASEAGAAGEIRLGNGSVALTIGGNGRRTGHFHVGDSDGADDEIPNSQLRQSGFNIGVSRTLAKTYFGGSYVFDDSKYGIPFVEEGETRLTPQRHAVTLRSGGTGLDGPISSYRATLGIKRYNHDELDGEEVATHFDNDTEEAEALLSHRQFGKMSGTFGGSFLNRRFNTEGDEVLAPPIDQRATALFVYEELIWPHVTVQFGGRFEHTSFANEAGLPDRTFNEGSGSLGLLLRPRAAHDKFAIALNLARAARNPALEELYYFGVHPGNFAFEIGNPEIGAEHALGFDVSLRARGDRVNGEITYFRNAVDDFLFRNPLDEAEVIRRTPEFNARFGTTGPIDSEGFPVIEYIAADSELQGIEAHADLGFTENVVAELGFDYVRGKLQDSAAPLPRIPPYRFIGGLTYKRNAFQVGGNITRTGEQERVFGEESPTEGYTLLKLFGSYSFVTGAFTSTITARVDNATNELYFNHLNYLKDILPEMGRNLKLVYTVSF